MRVPIAAAAALALLVPATASGQVLLPPPPQVPPPVAGLTQTVGHTVTTVEGTANRTVTNAENTVNGVVHDVTGSGGTGGGGSNGSGGSFGDTPSTSPGSTSQPPSGTDLAPAATGQSTPAANGSRPSPARKATATTARAPAPARASGGGARAAKPTHRGAKQPAPTTQPSPGGFIGAVAAMPWSFFAACIGLAILGFLMAGRSAFLSRLTRRLTRQRAQLREDVGALQEALLPTVPEQLGGLRISAAYRPAGGPAAGGDFHDVIPIDGSRTGIIVGDVSGHGRDALTVTALVHYTVRAYLETGMAPRDALRLADRALGGKLGEHFVTVIAAVYHSSLGTLDYASAGHPAPLLFGAGADHAVETVNAPPIGVGPQTGWRQTRIALLPGTRICFVTDGLLEARSGDGEMIGREGLIDILEDLPADAGADDALERARGEASGADDLTVCILEPEDAAGDGTITEEVDLGAGQALRDGFEDFLADCGLEADEVAAAAEELRALSRRERPRLRLVIHRHPDGSTDWKVEGPGMPVTRTSVHPVVRQLERTGS